MKSSADLVLCTKKLLVQVLGWQYNKGFSVNFCVLQDFPTEPLVLVYTFLVDLMT